MAASLTFDITARDGQAKRSLLELAGTADVLQKHLARVGSVSQKILRPVSTLAAAGAAVTSAATPAAASLVKFAAAGVHVGATLSPLVGTLPAVAAGFLLVKGTLTGIGPAAEKALKPIPTYFEHNQKAVDRLATRGLPQLAKAFVHVNAPEIGKGMERIARATNSVVRDVGKWVNSVNGQKAVKTVVEGTATAAERLAPHLSAAVKALGNLVARSGGVFPRLGGILVAAADGAKRLLDGISAQKLHAAWVEYDRIAATVKGLPALFRKLHGELQTGLTWWTQNRDRINEVHGALVAVAFAAGALSGNWLPALAAGGTLLVTNWGPVKGMAEQVGHGFTDLYNSASPVGAVLRGLVDMVTTWGDTFVRVGKAVWPVVKPVLSDLATTAGNLMTSLAILLPVIKVIGVVLIDILGGAAATAAVLLGGLLKVVRVLSGLFNVLLDAVVTAIRGILNAFGDMLDGLGGALEHIPGPFRDMGRQLKAAAGQVHGAANDVQNWIDGIHGKRVDIDVVTTYKVGVGTDPAGKKVGYRAGGGPVRRGMPYVVGERGPEMFIPNLAGRIVNATQTRALSASTATPPAPTWTLPPARGGDTYVVNVHLHGTLATNGRDVEDLVVAGIDRARRSGRLPRSVKLA